VSDLAGRVLAGRYLLHSAIGTGASGRVYVAEDTRLRRRVAVKILHAALAEDTAFLRRFRAEAQVAASLHHPHIVTVHDWGEDDVPFMVLELLEGGSLRSILDRETHLSVPQAARVGRDVASALEYAHARGILHRDIKPANLLFDEHGIVRVADFGLARALAEASWTEPSGAVFGTARYASPEQAMGVQLDARSDLYSLSLVLVEAVTGKVPFAADTTIGMLTARTQRAITAPDELGPLAPVVERAGRIDVTERYPDAATMRAALVDVGELLPPPGPLPLAGMVDGADPHPTRTQAPSATAALFDQDAPAVVPELEPTVRRQYDTRRLVPFVVAAAVVIMIALASVAMAQVGGGTQTEVPGLVGYDVEAATAQAERAGFDIEIAERENAPDPAGTVIAQSPAGGTFTDGDNVRVTVSEGPAAVVVPEVVGKSRADAEAALSGAGFRVLAREEYSDTVAAGVVAGVEPSQGSEVAPEAEVTLVVSKGRAPVAVADVRGKPLAEAKTTLEGQGFTVTQGADQFSNEVAAGLVISTNPATGQTIQYGANVEVVVSKGPDLVAVPQVVGQLLGPALALLEQNGLSGDPDGPLQFSRPVRNQAPVAGTMVPRGSVVNLNV
jgi:beta-lactam-binding protein with PASTA domain/tRNA A-37 threonylcarbamoyl transferase component Bud32